MSEIITIAPKPSGGDDSTMIQELLMRHGRGSRTTIANTGRPPKGKAEGEGK